MPEFLNGSGGSPENKGYYDIIYVKYVFYNAEDFSYSNVCILQRGWQFKGTVNDNSGRLR